MSIYSECFSNGTAGRCDPTCSVYQRGECESHILDNVDLNVVDLTSHLEIYPEDVQSFVEKYLDLLEISETVNKKTVSKVIGENEAKKFDSKCNLCGTQCDKKRSGSFMISWCGCK